MQITIDSKALLKIFLEAGIDNVNAKALVLDIITLQETPPTPPKKESTEGKIKIKQPKTPPAERRTLPIIMERPPVVEDEEEIEDEPEGVSIEEDEEEEDRPTITRVSGRGIGGSRPNFSAFGGDSTGLK